MSNEKENLARATILPLLENNPNLCRQFIRLAFYDAISYDPVAKANGPHGLIRFWDGLAKDAKMKDALKKLDDLKIPNTSYADLYQLAGVLAVEKAKGPRIDFQYGRVDSLRPMDPSRLRFISEEPVQDFVPQLADRLHRIGFTPKEIVALSLAPYYWMNETDAQPTFDPSFYAKLLKQKDEILNSKQKDEVPISKADTSTSSKTPPSTTPSSDQLNKSTSTALPLHPWKYCLSNPSYFQHVKLFTENTTTIEQEYGSAHKKLSELGFQYFPQSKLQEAHHQSMKQGYILAVAMTILVGFVGFFFEVMRS